MMTANWKAGRVGDRGREEYRGQETEESRMRSKKPEDD